MLTFFNVKNNGHIHYVNIGDLPEDDQKPFKDWLYKNGKTQPIIDEEADPNNCAYPWDYELWVSYRR
jgi:hypothetical protein